MAKITYEKIVLLLSSLLILLCLFFYPSEEHSLGKSFTYFENPSFISYWNRKDTLQFEIPPVVQSYTNTKNYILAQQHPNKNDDYLFPHYDYPYGRDSTYYWFIDKQTKELTGPLLYSEMELFLKDRGFLYLLMNLSQ